MVISRCLLGVTVSGDEVWSEYLAGVGEYVGVAIIAPPPEDSTFQTGKFSNLPPLEI